MTKDEIKTRIRDRVSRYWGDLVETLEIGVQKNTLVYDSLAEPDVVTLRLMELAKDVGRFEILDWYYEDNTDRFLWGYVEDLFKMEGTFATNKSKLIIFVGKGDEVLLGCY